MWSFASSLLGGTAPSRSPHPAPTTPPSAPPGAAPRDGMRFTRTDTRAACVIRIEGALDIHSAPELRATFDSAVAAHVAVVVLELDGLTLVDSSGVGAIVSLFKRLKASGGRLVVTGVHGQPLAVFKLLKLERVFGF